MPQRKKSRLEDAEQAGRLPLAGRKHTNDWERRRHAAGLTLRELSERSGVAYITLWRVEKGSLVPGKRLSAKILGGLPQ